MRRRLGHAYASVALLIAGMGVGPTLGQESQNPPPRDRTSEFLQKMNERQRMHAHLFQDPDYTRRLLDTLQSIDETSMYFLTPEEIDQKEQFRQLFCSSDAVFGGVVKTSESFPTENRYISLHRIHRSCHRGLSAPSNCLSAVSNQGTQPGAVGGICENRRKHQYRRSDDQGNI